MIKLNCSYEESKKILELGYDFSKVCDRFLIKQESCGWGEREEYFFRMNDLGDIFPLNAAISTYDEVWDHGMSIEDSSIKEITPIIPKAALEACLPGGLLVDIRCLSTDFRKNFSTPYSKESIELFWDGHSMEADTIIHKSYSIFEMFVWLHENYPEELKIKLLEVTG